jgi:hypothetical protein
LFTSVAFGIGGSPGSEAAAPSVGSGRLLKGFSRLGNTSPRKDVSASISLILSITSIACSNGFGAPIAEDLTSNNSATSGDIE